jgi:hypothetical protein
MSSIQKGGNLYNVQNSISPGVLQYVYYLVLIIIIVMLILVLVNYTVTPIFRLHPGGKGIISLPGSDDSTLYWKNSYTIAKQDTLSSIGTITQDWSFMLDIHLDNPTANTGKPRVIFSRGPGITSPATPWIDGSSTILTLLDFNVCVYLDSLTNDLYVSVQLLQQDGTTTMIKTIKVPNIPVGKSIRLGVYVGSKVLEVYVNGYLLNNIAFPNTVKAVLGPFNPPTSDVLSVMAQVANLRVWPRPVSPAEFRSYGAPSESIFKSNPMPDSCLAGGTS